MAQYLSPGVYVKEVPSGEKPIEGVGTSTGAFVGIAEKGPIGKAELIANWMQFVSKFGGYIPNGYLAFAVNQFFSQGGTRCYVVRTCHYENITKKESRSSRLPYGTLNDKDGNATMKVMATSEGTWGNNIKVEVKPPTNPKLISLDPSIGYLGFTLVVKYNDEEVEVHPNLEMDKVEKNINGKSAYIVVEKDSWIKRGIDVIGSGNIPKVDEKTPQSVNLKYGNDGLSPASAGILTDDKEKPSIKVMASAGGSYGNDITVEVVAAYLFNWDGIPGNDNNRLIKFLNRKYGIDWVKTAKIEKIDADKTIKLSTEQNNLSLKLNDDETEVNLEIDDGRKDDFVVKKENSKLNIYPVVPDEFKLTVIFKTKSEEVFDELTIENAEGSINGISSYIKVEKDKWLGDDGNEVIGSGNIPKVPVSLSLIGGKDDSSALWDSDFIGDEAGSNGLHAFDPVDDINIVAIPDRPGDREVILGGLSYCENEKRRDCFFIADPPLGRSPTEVADFKNATGEFTGQNAFNSSFGALYYPWVKIINPLTGGILDMPPSGTVAGTYAYTDSARGVHKAPAGITEGKLGSVTGIERIITKSEHDGLNPIGINVIRSFPTSGICIWGTRTLSADPEWRYLNIRRLFLFLEESIDKGSQWVVFEPNTPALWGSVKRNLTAFLLRVWRDGAFFGTTPEEAFFVKVDAENNPEEVRNAGQLIIDIGVAPVRPAEFVIFRITQKTS